jgi:hypothetical protein
MEIEAAELDRIAFVFDPDATRVDTKGTCDVCQRETPSVQNMYCERCAVKRLRDLAKHLRTYL